MDRLQRCRGHSTEGRAGRRYQEMIVTIRILMKFSITLGSATTLIAGTEKFLIMLLLCPHRQIPRYHDANKKDKLSIGSTRYSSPSSHPLPLIRIQL
eukprot:scaffold1607_cov151-Skeletonema_menzelii.AAC.1